MFLSLEHCSLVPPKGCFCPSPLLSFPPVGKPTSSWCFSDFPALISLDCFQNKPESPKNQGSTTPVFGHWRTGDGVPDPKGQLTAFLSTLCQQISLPCIPTRMVCLPHFHSLCRQSHLHSLQRPCQVGAPLHPMINIMRVKSLELGWFRVVCEKKFL